MARQGSRSPTPAARYREREVVSCAAPGIYRVYARLVTSYLLNAIKHRCYPAPAGQGFRLRLSVGEGVMLVSHPVVRDEEIRLAVQSIVASETFNRSQQLCRLLRYLCDAAIVGNADRLSEHAIGTDALGRSADFDPAEDAAVRVEMHRLRRRLRDYYAGEGAESSVRIEIPVGSYAPVLRRLEE